MLLLGGNCADIIGIADWFWMGGFELPPNKLAMPPKNPPVFCGRAFFLEFFCIGIAFSSSYSILASF